MQFSTPRVKTRRSRLLAISGIALVMLQWVFCPHMAPAATDQVKTSSSIMPERLRCEQMSEEALINTTSPRFSWTNTPLDPEAKGLRQSAYRIVVASSAENLAKGKFDVWDSRKTKSDDQRLVAFGGKPLKAESKYYYQIKVWDGRGKQSPWSKPASFATGVKEWQGSWLGGQLLMKEVVINKPVRAARAFVTAMGYFDLNVNGRKVGNDYFVPNFTNYTRRNGLDKFFLNIGNEFSGYRVLYLAYDIDSLLYQGTNRLTVNLGNGFANDSSTRWTCPFGEPRFLAKINVDYADGTREVINTDESWFSGNSPIVMNSVYQGEVYDANQTTPRWQPAHILPAPTGELTPQSSPSDKVTATYKPLAFTPTPNGTWIVEFPEEISGWIRFNGVRAHKGDTIKVKYFCESPLGVHQYISDGKPAYYNPRFTWYVFSKAEISGAQDLLPSQIVAEAVNTDVPEISRFSSSDSLLAKILKIWRRSQKDNMHGAIASDCPHRERSAYTGDGQLATPAVMANFDAEAFYRKWLRDIRDSQNPNDGYVPNGAPWQPGCGGGVGWGAAMTTMPYEYYLAYGDTLVLSENYTALCRQVDYMTTWLTPEGTMYQRRGNVNTPDKPSFFLNLGDWLPPFGMPSDEQVHTYMLWKCADYAAKAAEALHHTADAAKYAALRDRVATAYHAKFYDSAKGSYGDNGCNIFAMTIGLPKDRVMPVIAAVKKEMFEKHGGHLTTGIIGTRLLFETLAQYGLNDEALALITAKGFPGFAHWIDQGATVTWENWNGNDSRNHPMFGSGLTWYNTTLAGLRPDPKQPGFKHFTVAPVPAKGLDKINWQQQTPYGLISINIDYAEGMSVTVPVGTTATITLPWNGITYNVEQGTHHYPRN